MMDPELKKRLPIDAKIVYEGIVFKIYQWQQKMFYGNYKTFEIAERNATVDIIPIDQETGKIVVMEQEQPDKLPFPCVPGGMIDGGETALKAAQRELLEETGYSSVDLKQIGEYFGRPRVFFHQYLFIAKNCKRVARQTLDSGEKITLRLVDFDEFLILCKNRKFSIVNQFIMEMYDALLDPVKKQELKNKIFN